jgi:glutathione S-transferase
MRATLYGIPGSHNVANAEAMLRYKGLEYRRRDLVPGAHRLLVRLLGFRGSTVPALDVARRRVLGTRAISRTLDQVRPDPRLFPAEADRRRSVEEAERFGEDVLQPLVRPIMWVTWQRDPSATRSFMAESRLSLPPVVTGPATRPVVALMSRVKGATDQSARAALSRLPSAVAQVDALIDAGVIGGAPPNAADCGAGGRRPLGAAETASKPAAGGATPHS